LTAVSKKSSLSATPPLIERVYARARSHADEPAYIFLADGTDDERVLTWSRLDQRARALAAVLTDHGAHGQRALLALGSGLPFIEALFGCWYAGAIAVPISLPRHRRAKHRLHLIAADATARFAIGVAETRDRLDGDDAERPVTGGLTWIDIDAIGGGNAGADLSPPQDQPIAVLQYTSGSTGSPKGVIVTHTNIMHNSALIAEACGHSAADTIAGWAPLFHDMGLIGLVIQAAYVGARCVLMSPERFLMRPWLWLRMIARYGACSSPAPNFAYDLCARKVSDDEKAQLDLGRWRNALNGSEPVRAATLDRFAEAFAQCGFRRDAFFQCYGLAEATLFVTGPDERRIFDGELIDAGEATAGVHVNCGRSWGDLQVAIVEPNTCRRLAEKQVGEVWVAGDSCAVGYWNDPTASEATFGGRIAGEDDQRWLRTGDLGYMISGDLFITGRRSELIIVAGRNHFPLDLERTVQASDSAFNDSSAAAFSVDIDESEGVVIVAEIDRAAARGPMDVAAIECRAHAALAEAHELVPHAVVLLRPGAMPRTTSGKISRRACRDAYVNGTLDRYEAPNDAPDRA
jgi:acyl-CoA synthetase (AMP-forming)/AMP-acid ligase II